MSTAPAVSPVAAAPPAFSVVVRAALLGGVAAGLAGAVVSWLLVEIPIRAALVIEENRERGHAVSGPPPEHGHGPAEEMFSRSTQVVGGMLAAVLAGLVLGLVFAVAFARLRPRLPGRTDFGRALTLATVGFVVVSLLPAIKYPANPPAVGDPATIGTRTLTYLSFLVAGLLVTAGAVALRRWLPDRWPPSWTSTVAVLGAITGYALLLALWPAGPDAVPADMPAGLIWQFRLSSMAELAALWLTLGLVTGLVLERRLAYRDPDGLSG